MHSIWIDIVLFVTGVASGALAVLYCYCRAPRQDAPAIAERKPADLLESLAEEFEAARLLIDKEPLSELPNDFDLRRPLPLAKRLPKGERK